MLRDEMKAGDRAFFYHSSCEVPGIAGIVEVVREGYPDATAFDRGHHHYDPDSDQAAPRWFMVDIESVRKLARIVTLEELRGMPGKAARSATSQARHWLSVLPVSARNWGFILSLA